MKRVVLIFLSAVCVAFVITAAIAQDKYPSRPIKVIVPYAPGAAPRPVLEALFRTAIKAMQLPETVEKLHKQNFNLVPNESLADANAWRAGEMKHWEGIIRTVKIDIAR